MPPITEYRSPRVLSYLAIAPLAGILSINVLFIILGFGEIVFPNEIELDDGSSGSFWLSIMQLVGFLEVLLRLLAAIFFLMWVFRIFKNLAPTKVRNSEHSPAWAVGFWFIPILNIFKPHQIMQQAWRDTDPDCDPKLNYITAKSESNSLILTWWITFIVSGMATRVVNELVAPNMSDKSYSLAIMVVSFIVVAAAYLAILVVREITDRQEKRAEKMLSVDELAAPPPPPTFN